MIKRIIQFARQGYRDIAFDTYDTDWDSEAYLTVSGQNSNNSVRVTDAFLEAVEADGDWNLTRRLDGKTAQDAEGARPLGEDRLRRLGLRRSRHPVPHHHQRLAHLPGVGADPREQSVLGIHVPRRHRLQSRLAQPAAVPRPRDQGVRRQGLRARRPALDADARDLGADGAVPLQGDRAAFLRLPHARPRLRQYRRAADVLRHRLRQRRGPRDLRRAQRDHDRARLCDLGRDRRQSRRVPRPQAERRGDAARHPQPQARRRGLGRRLRAAARRPDAARPCLADQGRRRLGGPFRRRARLVEAMRWRSAKTTATATRRSPSSPRPARSAS